MTQEAQVSPLSDFERRRLQEKEKRAQDRLGFQRIAKSIIRSDGNIIIDKDNPDLRILNTEPLAIPYRSAVVKMGLEEVVSSNDNSDILTTDRRTTLYATPPYTRERTAIFTVKEHFEQLGLFSEPFNQGTQVLNMEGKVASNAEVTEALDKVNLMAGKFNAARDLLR